MKKSIKLFVVCTASTLVAHLIADAIRSRREQLYRHAAGESDYERTHPHRGWNVGRKQGGAA